MKKNRRIIKIATLVAFTVLGVASCDDDFLDKKPLGTASYGDLGAGGYEEQAFGLYGKLRTEGGVADFSRVWFQSIRSDDAAKGSTATDAATLGNIYDSFQYDASEGWIAKGNWTGHYRIIYACNDLIIDIENSGATDEGTLINKAEAMAIRAFCYFDLRRDFGEVPLILHKIVVPSDEIAPKSTVAEIDTQIVSDLEFAKEYLPISWPSYPGRATKGFAQTLLGKLYLYQQNWSAAESELSQVMTYGYSLYNSFSELFLQDGDNSTESVFEVQFLRLAGVNYSNNYWETQGVRGTGTWDLGWGFNVPTQDLVDAFETGDPRKDATILYSGQTDGYGLTVPNSPPLAQPYWNKKAYTKPSERTEYSENKNHWANIKILRYADVLLMYAEALNELGQSSAAVDYINVVRSRARGGNSSVLPDISATDQTAVRDAIKQERRVEFAMEGERFYDLVRWGDAQTVLGSLGYQAKNQYYPIPQSAIDQSGGVLIQNPNY
ncbi:RagB/SusD family nutrient uptake outer membrane protein [Flavobacterium sp. NRK F10]|uniref:RagB/SusD family nutrient uptake outer membrane protein n=1 Tax=Flavobacterium sp. NRK F10 TaxID=2954931 RepID=UPI00209024FA|nr:RagB/SusD family nutrient uptake outer membrane protein [Flavobacterium sp. NRK F10]MCO6175792.1 RagB/SusD family nutrient uptake outer membrane protein [Flavobacterium sp. NRK F10]